LAAAAALRSSAAVLAAPEWGNFTASAILGWYAWHTASKTIPGLVRHFREELVALRTEQRQERRDFHDSLAATRAAQHADVEMIAAAIHEPTERLR
jgi:hypothetical protein